MATKKKIGKSAKYTTLPGMASFPHIFEPDVGGEYSDGKYKIGLLFNKDSDMSIIENAIKEAVANHEELTGKKLSNINSPIKDGDEKADSVSSYKGKWLVNFKTKNKPQVIGTTKGSDGKPLPLTEDQFQAGNEVRVSFVAAVYERPMQGVTLYLGNVQKTGEGTPIGGSTAEDDFGSDTVWEDSDDDAEFSENI